ncbi:class I SAM-dependent DNA methyltransferase [Kineococcus arenarius]|uniref:class I SAM-dependent DNA methyltransferase n=1 Tax=unclassified Kineococcus TaxID=2621656 RepID=UPI003D7E748E
MRDFDPATSFLGDVAVHNDDDPRGDETETVRLLTELAHGRALEFAVGSGRIALPLSAAGVEVTGIDLSPDMLAVMRDRPGGDTVATHLGDMTTTKLNRRFPLVYLVFNSIFNLLTQDEQVRCFQNAAEHLDDDGVFLIEAAVPSAWLRGRDFVAVEKLEASRVTLDINRYDPMTQVLDESHVTFEDGGVRLVPISCRLSWPPELDLMARLAGLRLVQRWGGWEQEPFTSDSKRHVSLYSRVAS